MLMPMCCTLQRIGIAFLRAEQLVVMRHKSAFSVHPSWGVAQPTTRVPPATGFEATVALSSTKTAAFGCNAALRLGAWACRRACDSALGGARTNWQR